jgi:O-antigen/teichoic acid export membrane protein
MLRLALQCIVLIYLESIILWILLELTTPFLYIFLLRKKIKKTYPWLNFKFKTTKEIRQRNKALLKKIKEISVHKFSSFITNGTDNIIIFTFINPATVAFVGNYQMIMNNIGALVSQVFIGTDASVGNLIAENDIKNINKVFWEMMALRFFFAGCASLLLYIGFDELITLWVGEKYLMSHNILLSLILIFFIMQIRRPVDNFQRGYGLYADIWAPIVQSILNLVTSIIFVIKLGVIGVFIGTIISQISIVLIWRPYYLFTYGFKIKSIKYWTGFGLHTFYLLVACTIYYFLIDFLNLDSKSSLIYLIFKLIKVGAIFSSIYFFILFAFSKGFRDLFYRFLVFVNIRFNK